ncbi:RNA polymerase sigma factor RpoD/SigA [Candidatus Woesearchaeota archaeon]|nr:RNA polymerase sigma factor RpoD/SigA [Candidatus Woesearchaeota archaeon]
MNFENEYKDISRYLKDVFSIPETSEEEKVKLSIIIQNSEEGSEEYISARNDLVASNLRLVIKMAGDYKGLGLSLDELVSEGNVGLIKGATHYDHTKGAKFSSYAAWWIKQSIKRALYEKNKTIRIPIASLRKIIKVKNAVKKLDQELGRPPTDEEVAKISGLSKNVVGRLRVIPLKTDSLDDHIDGESGDRMSNLIEDVSSPNACDELMFKELKKISKYLDNLNEREADILARRFGLRGYEVQTLEEISEVYDKTRERVRQIQNRALQKLRPFLIKDGYGNKEYVSDSKHLHSDENPFKYKVDLDKLLEKEYNNDLLELYKDNEELQKLGVLELMENFGAFYRMMVNDPRYKLEFPNGFKKPRKSKN